MEPPLLATLDANRLLLAMDSMVKSVLVFDSSTLWLRLTCTGVFIIHAAVVAVAIAAVVVFVVAAVDDDDEGDWVCIGSAGSSVLIVADADFFCGLDLLLLATGVGKFFFFFFFVWINEDLIFYLQIIQIP